MSHPSMLGRRKYKIVASFAPWPFLPKKQRGQQTGPGRWDRMCTWRVDKGKVCRTKGWLQCAFRRTIRPSSQLLFTLGDLVQVAHTPQQLQFPHCITIIMFRVHIPLSQFSGGSWEGLCQKKEYFFIHRSTCARQKLLGFLEFLVRSPTIRRKFPNTRVSFNKQLHHLSRNYHPQPQHRRVVCENEVFGCAGHPEWERTHVRSGAPSCQPSYLCPWSQAAGRGVLSVLQGGSSGHLSFVPVFIETGLAIFHETLVHKMYKSKNLELSSWT